MTLGQFITAYRSKHDLSQRKFATLCDVSNGYISMLEKGFNPKTKEPIIPTLLQLKKLASGMGMSVSALIEAVDDMPIELSALSKSTLAAPEYDEGEKELIDLYRRLPEHQRLLVLQMIKAALGLAE